MSHPPPQPGRTRLDDGWQVRGCLGDTWRWLCGPGRPSGEPGWLPARVPGTVLDDVHRAGLVPDPYTGRNSLAAEWVPQRTWLYRRSLRVSGLTPGRRALLRFDGVDHGATVLLDGEEVARHADMFTPFEVEVTDRLADGEEHLLAVAVHPAPHSEPQVGRTDRVRLHRPRMDHGWDFCPRLVHQGIWRPVTLEVAGPSRLAGVTVGALPTQDGESGSVRVEARTDADSAGCTLRVRVHAPEGGGLVARAEQQVTPGATTVEATVPRPRLWWPNGHGEQPMYTVVTTLTDAAGRAVGTHRTETAFRRLRLVATPGAPGDALPYTLQVNGRRVHLKGWNWVPPDARYGVPRPELEEHLLRLAADAHVTLLRVWGGGLIGSEDFYRSCDRLGLLVWQEFLLSSSGIDSVPAADEEYVRRVERAARTLVPALRHHPSLAVWGPGNELQDTARGEPLTEADSPVIAALAGVVAALDPDRAWLPGSPSGPGGAHDAHGPWEHQGLERHHAHYDGLTCMLHSEFGVEGMANKRTWQAVVPPGERWPTGLDNPVMAHLGAWWNNTPLVRASFGDRIADEDTMRRASQQLQYDGLRYAVEAHLRRAPRSSGVIPWQFDEPFPNAWCTAAVDHRGDPKPAYHGVRRAYRPDHVCARFPTQAWGGRDEFTAELWSWTRAAPFEECTVTARLLDMHGTVHAARTFTAGRPPDTGPPSSLRPAHAGVLRLPLAALPDGLSLLDLSLEGPDGTQLAGNRYLHSSTSDLAPLLDLPPAHVDAEADTALAAVELRHTGGPAALGLYLSDARPYDAPGWAVFADNMLDLLPGETARVPVQWRAAPATGRAAALEGWNLSARTLR
ncbi:hypothetical protein [Streptomyces sp. PU-14G]|uniref:glycoside hydrolase family 2 protein n=1 Tax=Streptomyces sp. PU-14G TaxID=2800808 RepID=UPI0034DE94A9